jgi:hypothetical protein
MRLLNHATGSGAARRRSASTRSPKLETDTLRKGPIMIKRLLGTLTASILAGTAHGAIAQTPMPPTPTTKILAVGTFAPGTDMSQVQRILPTEVRETAQLYLDGKIDQWYSLEDRPGVVFIVNVTDIQAAHAMLEELPLGKAHLMTFQLMPIGPLNPLRQLLVPPVSR